MKLNVYLDITGEEKVPSDFKVFTDERPHPEKGRRFVLIVDVPDVRIKDLTSDL